MEVAVPSSMDADDLVAFDAEFLAAHRAIPHFSVSDADNNRSAGRPLALVLVYPEDGSGKRQE